MVVLFLSFFILGVISIGVGIYLLKKLKENKKEYIWVGKEGDF